MPKKRSVHEHAWTLLVTLLAAFAAGHVACTRAFAQQADTLTVARAERFGEEGPTIIVASKRSLDLTAASNTSTENVLVLSRPSATLLRNNAIREIRFVGARRITIRLAEGSFPAGDTAVEVTFSMLTFTSLPREVRNLSARGGFVSTPQELLARTDSAIRAIQPQKTSDERAIFAAFNLESAPDDSTRGAADVALNFPFALPFVTQGYGGLRLKKGATANGDPQFLDLAVGFRNVFFTPRIRRTIRELRSANANGDTAAAGAAVRRLEGAHVLGYIASGGVHLEGDALQFDVTNFIGELNAQIAVPTFAPLGPSSQLSIRFMPAGLELGSNVSSDGTAEEGGSITRVKAGADLILAADFPNQSGSPRIELSANGVGRYLFSDEQQVLAEDSVPRVINGFRGWLEVNGKLLLVNTSAFCVGVGLTYHHGMLPPTFQLARAFQFGLIFETADDKHQAR